jgi:predicted HAD superfamily Cof-like phosphohydrolase
MTLSKDVLEFMNACDQEVSHVNSELYLNLIKEEYEELLEGVRNNDRVEILDALEDLKWVIAAYSLCMGFDSEGAWNEVKRSNMSKLDPITGKAIKRADGKILKPETFSQPDLTPFV